MAVKTLVDEFLLSLVARRLSHNTELDYARTLSRLVEFVGTGADVAAITPRQIEIFMSGFRQLSPKSLQNIYIGLSAFWTWLVDNGHAAENIIHRIKRPAATPPPVIPFTELEIRRMLDALGRRPMLRAAVYILLDTGVRASELRDIDIGDIDLRRGEIIIRHGKGDKGRVVPFSQSTGHEIARYLATRADRQKPDAPLFIATTGSRLDRRRLTNQLANLGKRAGVPNVHPHRFRHTFSVCFLRNGGNVYVLQSILGHSNLETTKRYIHLAEIDIQAAFHRASPIDNWRL